MKKFIITINIINPRVYLNPCSFYPFKCKYCGNTSHALITEAIIIDAANLEDAKEAFMFTQIYVERFRSINAFTIKELTQ